MDHNVALDTPSNRRPQNDYTSMDQLTRSRRKQSTTVPTVVVINTDATPHTAAAAGAMFGSSARTVPFSSIRRMVMSWTMVLAVFCLGPSHTLAQTNSNDASNDDGGTSLLSGDEDNHEQLVLGPMRICLYPTPISLPESGLQDDVRTSLLELVTHTMTNEWTYSDVFEYFEFTDATIEWFSGVPNMNETTTTTTTTTTTGTTKTADGTPCGDVPYTGNVPFTQLSYQGVVLLLTPERLSNDTIPTITDLESYIGGVIEGGLVQSLHNLVITKSSSYDEAKIATTNLTALQPYLEIQIASVSFGGGDDDDDDDEEEEEEEGLPGIPPFSDGTSQPTPSTIPKDTPSSSPIGNPSPPFDVDSAPTAPPPTPEVVPGLQSSTSSNRSADNRTGMTVGTVIGSLLVVSALLILFVHRRQKKERSQDESNSDVIPPQLTLGSQDSLKFVVTPTTSRRHWATDLEQGASNAGTVPSYADKANRVDGGGGGSSGHRKNNQRPQRTEDGGEDASEMAQYSQYQHGDVMDSRSVTSEWTLGTSDDTSFANRSAMTGNTPRLVRAAEVRASNEAFERDRRITLQKDMLQTEWSAATAGTPTLMFGGGGGGDGGFGSGPNTLSFEEAYDRGQGEEIYLMPPRPLRRSNSQRSGPAIV